MKASLPLSVCKHGWVLQLSASVFVKVNSLYIMIYEQNDSLRVSTGPSIEFELCKVTRTESEHKNLLISCHVTHLMAALQDKTLSDDSPSSNFWKNTILGPAPINGLSWTIAKSVCSSLWSSKVDTEIWTLFTSGNGWRLFAFPTKPYVNWVCAQSLIL